MRGRFIDLIIDVPALCDRQFTYELPAVLSLPVDAKVRVPFGRAEADAFVAAYVPEPVGMAVKQVGAVYDLEFMPSSHLRELARMMAEHYCAPLSACLSCLWPEIVPKRKITGAALDLPDYPAVSAGHAGGREKPLREIVRGDFEFRWARYESAIRPVVEGGGGAIFLVPEVKGIDEAQRRLEAAFPGKVANLHSELTGLARRGGYLSLIRREKPIALGTRSAIFAPVSNLGIIVLDEEPSEAYKSPDSPFYDSRAVALFRSGIEGCGVVFGSGHPSVESVNRVLTKEMTQRAPKNAKGLPPVTRIDLRGTKRGGAVMSQELVESLRSTFLAGGKAVLFLNRRGSATQVTCRECGETLLCPRCNVPFSHHSKEGSLVCHTCGQRVEAPEACPKCGGRNWYFAGFGIERAQSEFARVFPDVPLFRLDRDTAKERPSAKALAEFGKTVPSCLLCTALGLGYKVPGVGLVGVLSSDTILNLPDYRASERVFHLLSSLREMVDPGVSGASFVVQTYNPDNPGIKGLMDADRFYAWTLDERRTFGYPPAKRLFAVHFRGRNEDRVKDAAASYAAYARSHGEGSTVLGPVPAPKSKVRGEYRWQVVLRGGDPAAVASTHKKALAAKSGVRVYIEADPI